MNRSPPAAVLRRRRRRMLRRTLLVGGPLFAVSSFGACFLDPPEDIDISQRPDNMPTQTGWETPLANPVLEAGDLNPRALWNDPTLLIENGQYVIWMTTSIETPFKPPIVPFRAVSDDRGKNWRLDPPTPVAMPTGTPFVSLETPSVVRFRGMYHMYFSGMYRDGESALMAIGHAVSPDGKTWRVSPEPVISETGRATDWNGVLVGEPGAIVRGDQIFVYFSAVAARASGVPPQDQTIGLATTVDGEHFGPATRVLAQASTYAPEVGFAGYSTPSPFELDGKVHLLVDVVLSRRDQHPEWQQVALHHAYSTTDGRGSFLQDDKPIFTRNSFPWTNGEVIGPSALVDEGMVKIWFGGHVPVSQLGPLVRRDYKGSEFGINFVQKPVAAFLRDSASAV